MLLKTKVCYPKNILVLSIGLAISSLIASCTKTDLLPKTSYRLEAIKLAGATQWQSSDSGYKLELNTSNSFTLHLDVNICSGHWSAGSKSVSFEHMGCTEACCDSELAEKFATALSQTSSYSIENNILWLAGRDSIRAIKIR